MHDKQRPRRSVTFRAVLIGLALIPINVYLVVQWETVWGTQYPTTMSIFFNAIFCLFLLSLLNLPLRRYLPRFAFNQGELLTVYGILLAAIAVSGHDFSQTIFCTLGNAHWFATPENEWQTLFWNYVPHWLTVNDDKVLLGFYEGESSFYVAEHIRGWIQPMLLWTLALTVLAFVMICINSIIRRQWIQREKLTYPLVHLPFEMTHDNALQSFFGNGLLWLGFGIAASIDLINGIHTLFPVFAQIPLSYDLGAHFVDRPWNAIGSFPLQVNPYAIGLAFPIPLDLLFSCWFFYLIWKLERVFGAIAGVSTPGYPFPDQQILGAFLGIALVALWMGRKYLAQILKSVVKRHPEVDDSEEPMSYRTAVLGVLFGLIFLVGFVYRAGMSISFGLAFFIIYYVILFAFTRMRAELGPPLQGIHYSGPLQLIIATTGSRRISPQTLTAAAPYWTHTKEIRNSPMPFYLESFKLADRAKMDTRRLWKVLLLATAVGIFVTFWAFLDLSYKWGGPGAWRGNSAYTVMERWMSRPVETDATFLGATAFGLVFVVVNTMLRLRFLWWSLHPLGYALGGYYHLDKLWFPFFISWAVKWTILKYGGIRAYRKAFPLFLGLVLGEFVIGSAWGIVGLLTGRPTYAFKNW